MLKFIQKNLSIFFSIILLCSSPVISLAAESNEQTINLELSTSEADAYSNFLTIENALLASDGSNKINVVFPKNQKFYITTTGTMNAPDRPLRIRSNTTIDLNGSTLIRTDVMVNQNVFQNCDFNGNRDTGGYALSENITIKNGTIDGNGSKATKGVNIVNIGHAKNVNVSNVQFKNIFEGHMIELSGCTDSVIDGCTFDGFYGNTSKENIEGEAIQLDIALTGWNGVYKSDATVCKNITVSNCTFLNTPAAVGNHHTLEGKHNQNIDIIGNTCKNATDFGDAPAIWCYAFDSCTVENNTINGMYGTGIMVSAGSNINVGNNTINLLSKENSYGIYATKASSYLENSNNTPTKRTEEYASSVVINENEISNYGKNGIFVASKTEINTLNDNTVSNGIGDGIYITGANANSITGNKVTGCKAGTDASSDGKCTSSDGCGIHIASTAIVKTCDKNTISGCSGKALKWTHTYGDWVIVKAATCAAEGTKERTCTLCGHKESNSIAKTTKHIYDSGKVTKAATCTATGIKTYTCTKCKTTKTETIKATGHKAVTDKAVAATCTKAGKTAGSHCSVCNAVITAQKTVAATGHTYDKGKVTKAATCTATGTKTYTCTKCKATKKETIKATGHSYKTTVTKATTKKNGSSVTKCTKCGNVSKKTTIYYPKTITLSTTAYTYDGKIKKPSVTVKDSKGKKIAASNYTVTYPSGRKNVGTYTVKITFKGNYSGSVSKTFKINPKNTSISGLTAQSKAFTVKLKKYTTQTTGYQIQYSTSSNFKNAKTVTVKNSTTSKKISKLSGKKKYYVRIRTYKTVGKTNYYSGWTKAKTVTTKK